MTQENDASASADRATRASHGAPTGLHHSAGIPSAGLACRSCGSTITRAEMDAAGAVNCCPERAMNDVIEERHGIPALTQDGIDPFDCGDYDDGECWQCGGEGYVFGCSWDWQCETYDEGEGTCLCSRRCDICNPPKLTPEEQAQHDELRKLLGEALNAQGMPSEGPRREGGSGASALASPVPNGDAP